MFVVGCVHGNSAVTPLADVFECEGVLLVYLNTDVVGVRLPHGVPISNEDGAYCVSAEEEEGPFVLKLLVHGKPQFTVIDDGDRLTVFDSCSPDRRTPVGVVFTVDDLE